MGRFAGGPLAGFVAQDAQPGVILGPGLGMLLQESLQPGERFGGVVPVVQSADQRKLDFAGLGKAGGGQAADLDADVRISSLAVGLGEFQPDGDIAGIGGHVFAEEPELVVAIPGIAGVPDLPLPDGGEAAAAIGRWEPVGRRRPR